jgi:hypothetical protein
VFAGDDCPNEVGGWGGGYRCAFDIARVYQRKIAA